MPLYPGPCSTHLTTRDFRSSDPSRPGQIRCEQVLPEKRRAVLTSLLPLTRAPAPAASLPLFCFDCWDVLTAPSKGRKKSGPVAWSPAPPFPRLGEKLRTLKRRGISQKIEITTPLPSAPSGSPLLFPLPNFLYPLAPPRATFSPFSSHLSPFLSLLEVRCQVARGGLKCLVAEDGP